MSDERCDLTELLPSDCGCPKHRDSGAVDTSLYKIQNAVLAVRDGVCVLNEDHLIVVEDEIGLVVDGRVPTGTVRETFGWACARCTREIQRSNP